MQRIKPHFEAKTHVIWDWNGTLLNDVALCTEVIGEVLLDCGLEKISIDDYRNQFCFPIVNYYKSLGFDFNKTPFEVITKSFVEKYNSRVHEVGLFEGAELLLKELASENKTLSILSAAHQEDLLPLLDTHDVRKYFSHVFGLDNHHAASKVERGKELIQQLDVDSSKILMVGDTDHDAEVAEAIGIDILLLGDGHQHPHRLESPGVQVIHSRY